ncbi:MAG: hypothetical protein AVDCRST_MAG01-01-4107, partial [uncultured Rubrobacteraceae bacterium]
RGDHRRIRLPGLRKGRQARGGDGLRGQRPWHDHSLPGLRQRPHPAYRKPRPVSGRPQGHEAPAGRGGGRRL